jgi:hypothetical protein
MEAHSFTDLVTVTSVELPGPQAKQLTGPNLIGSF